MLTWIWFKEHESGNVRCGLYSDGRYTAVLQYVLGSNGLLQVFLNPSKSILSVLIACGASSACLDVIGSERSGSKIYLSAKRWSKLPCYFEARVK